MTDKKYFLFKNFDQPDEKRDFQANGHLDLIHFKDGTSIGRGIFEPGWKWSNDVKPIAETESCDAEHHGYCISGSMTIRMDDGQEFTVRAGDAFYIEAGHDAWVKGDEPCVVLDMTGFKEYALPKEVEEKKIA